MQRLIIEKLGPIESCEVEISDYMVLTGEQSSGKSTVAKCIYLFNSASRILFSIYKKQIAGGTLFANGDLEELFIAEMKRVFEQSFGMINEADSFGSTRYDYDGSDVSSIEIRFDSDSDDLKIMLSEFLHNRMSGLSRTLETDERKNLDKIQQIIYSEMFVSDMEVVYIPAGRSMLTVLSSQINYLYSVMDDRIKSSIDYCTQQFIESVLMLKDYFNKSYTIILRQLLRELPDYEIDVKRASSFIEKAKVVLGGEYRSSNGEERLYYDEARYVKINFASSGQQEVVWMINILFYYLIDRRKVFFIIEEPESHLFPEAQKTVMELISLAKNCKNRTLITTHSPYVLGTINNMLFANVVTNEDNKNAVESIVPEEVRLDFRNLGAYFLEDGKLSDIRDYEYMDIDHDVIDGVSRVINEEYEKMTDISRRD